MRLPESVGAPLVGALRGLLWRPNLDAIALFSLPLRPFAPLRAADPSRPSGQKVLPLPFSAALRGQKVLPLPFPPWTKGVAVAVLRAPPRPSVDKRCCRCRSPCPSAALRGQKVLPLPFSAPPPLRGPPWTKGVAVAVLRAPPRPSVDKRCCRCRSPCPSAALRGQKVLPLPFSVPLRGPPWTKGVAVAVLRAPPRPSVDKRCCRCRSPCPSAALRGQKVLPLPFSVPLRGPPWTKGVAVAVLRAPPQWHQIVDKRCWCRSPCPSAPLVPVLRPSRAILASELRCVCPDLHPHSTGKISPHVRQFTPA